MTHVVLFACPGLPDKATQDKYHAALSGLGSYELAWIALPGFSSVFVTEGQRLRRLGRLMPTLLATYAPQASPTSVSLISFSAGYGLARELLVKAQDQSSLDALVCLDSVHTGLNSDGTPNRDLLLGFADYAELARDGDKLFVLAHSDVPTYGYASTTQSAAAVSDMAGGPGGNFSVHAYDTQPDSAPKAEHGAALTQWGPELVRDYLVPYLVGRQPTIPPPRPEPELPWRDPCRSLGDRAVERAYQAMRDGLGEDGNNGGEFVETLFGPAVRDGKPLYMTRGNWCAVFACWCERESLLPGETPTTEYRVSGLEMQEDAEDAGTWRPVWSGYRPKRGDVAILKRGTGWSRHVCRVLHGPTTADAYVTIGGNEGNQIRITGRNLQDPGLLGFIEGPPAPKVSGYLSPHAFGELRPEGMAAVERLHSDDKPES